jgi:hypothetical protein
MPIQKKKINNSFKRRNEKKQDNINTINGLGNSFINMYDKNNKRKHVMYGIDLLSLTSYLPISKKIILIILLCV